MATFTAGSTDVFLISLEAGGFGLNLTEADCCFMLEPRWNPAAEAQAIDRALKRGLLGGDQQSA
ncbi:SWF/SNF helicase family protein [Williamsia sp. CHRR-6]|nr:C-terminal helicase domain-containing protein [Williamsia sp. CHRR-6]MBT0567675.1 SWF/SNF helicase family protein [Williamsia sp. CHRR-6]